MTSEAKSKLIFTGEQLSTVGVEFRLAQIGLEKMVEQHGMNSPEAAEASALCGTLALRFSALEDEFWSILASELILTE